MSVQDLNTRHLKLISSHGARYALRGGTGLVFIMLVLICGLLVAHILITPVEQIKAQLISEGQEFDDAELMDQLVDTARPAIKWAVGERVTDKMTEEEEADATEQAEAWTSYLLDDRPAMLSAVLLILLFSLPFLIAVGAFNQFSGDVQTRGLRFLLLRTERANLFFGRFLGTTVFSIGTVAVLIATIALYVGIKLRIYEAGDIFVWSLLGFAAMAILTLPYVALCSWISSCVDSPFASLSLNSLIIGAVPLFALIGRNTWEPAAYVRYLLPWGVQNDLLSYSGTHIMLAAAACLGYTVIFLALGYRHFSRRDL